MRRLATQFDDPRSPGGVATPTCCGAGACCSCCCCVGTLLTASTVSAMRLYDAAVDNGRSLPARRGVAAGGALLFPALLGLAIALINIGAGTLVALLLSLELVVLAALWAWSGARWREALGAALAVTVVTVVGFGLELGIVAALRGLGPGYVSVGLYVLLIVTVPVMAGVLQRYTRAGR